jgi:hypothetical protein
VVKTKHSVTNSMEKRPSWEADRSSGRSRSSPRFMQPHLQEPATCSYPEPDQSSLRILIPLLENPF